MDYKDFFSNFAVGSGKQCKWTSSRASGLTDLQLEELQSKKILTLRRGNVQKVYYRDPTGGIWKTVTNESVSVTDIKRALRDNNLL